jgi:hypothetical protein
MTADQQPAAANGPAAYPGLPPQRAPYPPNAPVPYGTAAPATHAAYGQPTPYLGHVRPTGTCVLLAIVTFGIYSWFWMFKVHQEMKDHSGRGIGGFGAVILWIIPFLSWFPPFLTSGAVGDLYRSRGWKPPVSGATGAWILLPLIGSIIWFVKTNGALNNYWRSLGATA